MRSISFVEHMPLFGGTIRANIVIDNNLIQQAMQATGLSAKETVVEEGL